MYTRQVVRVWYEQASKPFSEKSKEYIAGLDLEKDAAILAAHGLYLRPECDIVRKVNIVHLRSSLSIRVASNCLRCPLDE